MKVLAYIVALFLVAVSVPDTVQSAPHKLPPAGAAEQKMFQFYKTKMPYMGAKHADDVLVAARWTRYYAKRAGLEDYMETLLCQWHVESQFQNVPGIDGLSFGRTQTLYGYQPRLRKWWRDRGEELHPSDDAISTQMAFGVAEFAGKLKAAKGNLFDAVRRYNGCGPGAVNYAKRVFKSRKNIYGIPSPKPQPGPCPCRKCPKPTPAKR